MRTMRVYLAGSYSRRDELNDYAEQLEALGHRVTSEWLNEDGDPTRPMDSYSPKLLASHASRDMSNIFNSDCVVIFTTTDYTHGGHRFEQGFAMAFAMMKATYANAPGPRELVTIGPRVCVFDYMEGTRYRHYTDFESYLAQDPLV